ncbi:CorA-like Mg2+ transporter protein [Roseimaritima multifibrata]|uniref:CorA-like Mg2+ transporter protein n=1 Tax=Roseimaritima multifibrata TaxID=1930274 RepID=A0A517MK44_9BACT|nr:CorA family divalent cation transporter [Roseimaritima multifibrata]QDS95255.1 CorA-like Mg2+ transporter protein [Roseimaritima multifibrata]
MANASLLPDDWGVPLTFRLRLGTRVGRQRMMTAEGHLLLILHAPPELHQETRAGRFFWRLPDGTWKHHSPAGSGVAMADHLNEYENHIDLLDKKEQKAQSSKDYFAVLEAMAPILRATRNMEKVLQEARREIAAARELIDFRDRAYQLDRTAELLVTGAKHALDFKMAQQAEEQSRASEQMAQSAHRLNVLAAFFFPLATISGLFGMDIRTGIGDLSPPVVFIGVLVVGLILGGVLTQYVRVPGNHRSKD